ncbi:hypothetical protein OG462_42270 [Streptomyces sp. NBC_01077]|nr:hypothetical protein OG462_02750 [Streptomyces sp. NBC_01077]WSV43483.1 hypothetical protein OG462_42270 [Streptomyces sp. NBC_01077]
MPAAARDCCGPQPAGDAVVVLGITIHRVVVAGRRPVTGPHPKDA